MREAHVRFYIDADILGLAKILTQLRADITYPATQAEWSGSEPGRQHPFEVTHPGHSQSSSGSAASTLPSQLSRASMSGPGLRRDRGKLRLLVNSRPGHPAPDS